MTIAGGFFELARIGNRIPFLVVINSVGGVGIQKPGKMLGKCQPVKVKIIAIGTLRIHRSMSHARQITECIDLGRIVAIRALPARARLACIGNTALAPDFEHDAIGIGNCEGAGL